MYEYSNGIPLVNVQTEKFNQAIRELDDLRNEIETASQKGSPLASEKITMAYAFPSLALSEGFRKYASEVVDAVKDLYETILLSISVMRN